MTTQPPPIEFKVSADARQAQEAIDGLNKKFKEGETASSMLDKRIEALTKDLDQLSTAIVSGKGNTEAYRASSPIEAPRVALSFRFWSSLAARS